MPWFLLDLQQGHGPKDWLLGIHKRHNDRDFWKFPWLWSSFFSVLFCPQLHRPSIRVTDCLNLLRNPGRTRQYPRISPLKRIFYTSQGGVWMGFLIYQQVTSLTSDRSLQFWINRGLSPPDPPFLPSQVYQEKPQTCEEMQVHLDTKRFPLQPVNCVCFF